MSCALVGWLEEKGELNGRGESNKEKDVGILICSYLEPSLVVIGQTVNGQEVVGICVVKVESCDASVGVEDSPYIDTRIF